MDHPIRYQPLHVPRADRQALIQPPLGSVGELLASNRAGFAAYAHVQIAGHTIASLRASTQQDLLQAAMAYTRGYRNPPDRYANFTPHPEQHLAGPIEQPTGPATGPATEPTTQPVGSRSILLSGHQPELFHPGVWFKNFALSVLAARHSSVPINLVIDSDAVKQTSIAVPTGSIAEPRREYVAYDQASPALPHEERRVMDPERFASFGQRAAETIRPLIADPLVKAYWPLVQEQTASGKPLGETLAQARHRLEGEWGLQTLELPQSHLCRLRGYHVFTAHLLSNFNLLWRFYNHALAEYRQVHHLRGAAQPLPDLMAETHWREMPYWCWSKSDPRRRPLFVRESGNQLILTNRAGWEARLPRLAEQPTERAAEPIVEQLAALEAQGVKLRTRALATTMFARLVLSDLFLHGIGGAKYDQVTDRLIELLLDLPAPKYLTLTATVKLPLDRPHVEPADATRARVRLRDLRFNPERYVPWDALHSSRAKKDAEALIAEKQRWIKTEQTSQNTRARHFEIRKASAALQTYVAPLREKWLAEQQQLTARLRAESVLGAREYAFCLYEATTLRAQLLEFLTVTP